MRILLLFVLVPLVELWILLRLADLISGKWTFALVVITGVLGATLARRQGFSVVRRIGRQLEDGQLPTTALLDALMIFLAGALLITPGILTDCLGFSLLIPACRRVYRAGLQRWFQQHVRIETLSTGWTSSAPRDRVIDSYVVEKTEESS